MPARICLLKKRVIPYHKMLKARCANCEHIYEADISTRVSPYSSGARIWGYSKIVSTNPRLIPTYDTIVFEMLWRTIIPKISAGLFSLAYSDNVPCLNGVLQPSLENHLLLLHERIIFFIPF
jgi:hypothetical protein